MRKARETNEPGNGSDTDLLRRQRENTLPPQENGHSDNMPEQKNGGTNKDGGNATYTTQEGATDDATP